MPRSTLKSPSSNRSLKELEDTEIPKVKNERAALVEAWPNVRKSDRREWPLQFAIGGASMLVAERFFIAETGEAVYLGIPDRSPGKQKSGELEFDHEVATLVRVPKDSVSGLTIGPIMDEEDAYRRSLVLVLALCRNARTSRVVTARTRTAKGTKARQSHRARLGCPPNRVRQLRRQLTAAARPGS
jgi:hypothetical protein